MSLPLVLPPFNLTETASVQVEIGPNYYTAQVVFYCEKTPVFSIQLSEVSLAAMLPHSLTICDTTITSGKLILNEPNDVKPGTVFLNCTYATVSEPSPMQVQLVIASWNLYQ